MDYAAVIVAKESLNKQALADLRAELPSAQEVKWLQTHSACEIIFTPTSDLDKTARRGLAARLQEKIAQDADIGVFPNRNRRKKLLLADMDSTMIEQECLDELSREMGQHDIVAAITERAMRGEIDFIAAMHERVALLKGMPLSSLQKVIDHKITFMPGGKTLVKTMKAHGAVTALVSGGFTLFTRHVADALGFDMDFANELLCENSKLTGKVKEPVLAGPQKRQALLDLCRQNNLEPDDALAIGDGANDQHMVKVAGLGIAYRAKPVLSEVADALIAHTDLQTALYFQGYAQDEFIS